MYLKYIKIQNNFENVNFLTKDFKSTQFFCFFSKFHKSVSDFLKDFIKNLRFFF